ncbi:ornithine cyclodeaminase/alanine dehydrogenase-like protein (mu-crystallin family) [Rhizobium sp. BK650]|uniref:ornithine cyclodeaminase family protein n=1 Tax=Rhizobium sp. BK650 TaxID=2586990 RepID=UPI00160A8445|nr:ornithine cyclodeaminase family protein [Rhizobium sp. BK650]MBB3660998.1 ornithine cyclodeaminase/alanine dehydrogenase-like protein (mu-crystallin family) [Rhizobium sp. BK650]
MSNPIPFIGYETIYCRPDIVGLAGLMRQSYASPLNRVTIPLRTTIKGGGDSVVLNAMPAYSEQHDLFVTKIGSVVPRPNSSSASVHAVVIAFSATTGHPIGIFDGQAITHLKCAAVTALVTDYCASPEANIMGLVGTGVQAREQLHAVAAVRDIREVRVHSRDPKRVGAFIGEHESQYPWVKFVGCNSSEEVTQEADVLSTATTSAEPVIGTTALERAALHINCFGYHTRDSRELPLQVLERDSILIVEDVQTAVEEAGDVHQGALSLDRLNQIDRDVLQSTRTIFSSTGHALLDLLTVHYVCTKLAMV